MGRYSRNIGTLTPDENESLKNTRVCVIGCGGLGGYIIELLGRMGVGTITAVDGDVFEESNLNRQILSDEKVLGIPKATAAQRRMKLVNSQVTIHPITERFTMENGRDILSGHHVIVDALDNIPSRMVLQDLCEALNIPFVHGAIAAWYGQVSTIFPGDKTLHKIYPDAQTKGIETQMGNPSFTPALVASIEVGEVIKILIDRGNLLRNKLLYINLLEHEFEMINL